MYNESLEDLLRSDVPRATATQWRSTLLLFLSRCTLLLFALQLAVLVTTHVFGERSPRDLFSPLTNTVFVLRIALLFVALLEVVRTQLECWLWCPRVLHLAVGVFLVFALSALELAESCGNIVAQKSADDNMIGNLQKYLQGDAVIVASNVVSLFSAFAIRGSLFYSGNRLRRVQNQSEQVQEHYANIFAAVRAQCVWKERHKLTTVLLFAYEYALVCCQQATHLWLVKKRWQKPQQNFLHAAGRLRAQHAVALTRCIFVPLFCAAAFLAWTVNSRYKRIFVLKTFFMHAAIAFLFSQIFAMILAW